MTASRKIGLNFACVIAVTSVAFGGWLLHRHSIKAKLSADANETRARAEKGDAAAQNKLGNLYLKGTGVPKDDAQAALWYRRAAEQGYAKAQFNLGQEYHHGEGVPKDYAEALHWLRKSADQGDERAESALGYMYFYAQGVPRDECQAFAWYRKSAEQGYPLAQETLGWMYYNGRGVKQDSTQGATWYVKAANQGDASAQTTLGYIYANGLGVERDTIGSLRYYRMAAAQGEPSAMKYLSSLKPPTIVHRIELGFAVFALVAGVFFVLPLLEFLVRRNPAGWRPVLIAVLGVAFLGIAVLNFYCSAHDIRYSPHRSAFVATRRTLEAIAVLILVTVVLPGIKTPRESSRAALPH